MFLDQRLEAQGDLLFRWRSFLPLILVPMAVVAMAESGILLQQTFGKGFEDGWEAFSIAVALCGVALRAATVGWVPAGTSGRNTRAQRAHQLNTTGLYSVVRNPLYLGNYLVLLGFALDVQVWWFVLLVTIAFVAYYERIVMREEAFLRRKFGVEYEAWAARTPAFLPRPRLWVKPQLPFSLRTVLRREYNGFYLVVVIFTLLEFGHDFLAEGATLSEWRGDWTWWLAALVTASVAYLVLRALKKHSRVLRVAGR